VFGKSGRHGNDAMVGKTLATLAWLGLLALPALPVQAAGVGV